ncbi:phage head closure protein [Tunturiibacter gelidiferens]|uniref:phage head closure protein n=1 Tax=Tunturiibacter gelidiferens TaxID=3069689 RepID=UPI003D9BDCCC
MNIGKLNRRIQIQSQSTTSDLDPFSQPTPASWQTIYSAWASVDIQASQLLYSTAEFVSQTTYRITLRWTSSVIFSAQQRVIYIEPTTGVTHTYEIKAVVNDKAANKQVTLLCYEISGRE